MSGPNSRATPLHLPDGHGSFARFSWTLSGEDGRLIATGTDIIRTTQDGQIEEVIGFLDKEFV